ncbi:unnamed protein product, partial [Iphiclides podalirius]
MPPMFRLDPYEPCVHEPGGVYCTFELKLVADGPNELMDMIQKYSAHREMHYNHSRLHRGICVTKTCKDHLSQNTSADLKLVLEGCLNDTLWKQYKLKNKVSSDVLCNDLDHKLDIDYGDIAVAIICLSIILLNIVGSCYDFFLVPNKEIKGNRFLLCFSIKYNWKKLVAPPADGPEARLKRFKGFNGLRTISIIIVIMEHSLLPLVVSSQNPHNFERKYYNMICHIFIDGALVVQTFFLMSGCLLSYNLELIAEKRKITWSTVGVEVKDCRRDGWLNLLYLNNYIDESQCMPQTWYIASDMQLYVLGLIILVLATTMTARKIILSLLFVIALIIPPIHTYFQKLDAGLVISPELVRDYFVKDPTFNHTYKRGHTNLACYIMGLSLGILIYYLQKRDFKVEGFQKCKFLYWATLPAMLIVLPSGAFFYFYEEVPIYYKAIYSGLAKPVFGSIIMVIVLGMAFKYENTYRGILEWKGWSSPARVSYCAYILHVLFVRTLTGSRTTLMHVSIAHTLLVSFGTVVITYVVAYPFYLFVEAPSVGLSKLILPVGKEAARAEVEASKRDRMPA